MRIHLLRCTAALLIVGLSATIPSPASAETQDKLRLLAEQFAAKIGRTLESADSALQTNTPITDPKAVRSFDAIPDGELLLLAVVLTEAKAPNATMYRGEEPITAIKKGYNVHLSLTDFSYVAGLEIKVNAAEGKAQGWYIHQDQKFELDLTNNSVKLGSNTYTFSPTDILIENDDLYVRETVLGDWFDFKADVELQAQRLDIVTFQQLPLQARLERLRRRKGTVTRERPEQPRLEREYQLITVPRADVLLAQRYQKNGNDQQATHDSTYSVLTSNQLLNHEMNSYFSGAFASSRERAALEQARINFRQESEDTDLLGPLKARTYEFNDINPVLLAGTGSAEPERGARISNRSSRFTVDTVTTIDGDAQPGWDVELYRGDAFISGTLSDNGGRYSFDNVPLFAGDNRFRILFYGPQGERLEDERIVTVLPGLIGNIKGYYDLSLSQKGTITYRADEADDEDRGTLRLVGSYDRRVNDKLTLRGGLHTREENGQRDNYFYSGAVLGAGSTIYNADLVTTSDGPFQTALTARRNFGRHSGRASIEHQSTDFSEFAIDDTVTSLARTMLGGNLSGPFMTDTLSRVTYDINSNFNRFEDGRLITTNELGLYSSYNRMRFRNVLEVSTDSVSEDESLQVSYIGGVTGRYEGYFWRGTLDYEIVPDAAPNTLRLDVDKNYSADLSGFAGGRHFFDEGRTELSTGLNYYAEKARLSPSVIYDTDNNLEARLDVRFGLSKDPISNSITMSSRPLSNQAGLVVFSYLDKDGNGVFNDDDEPLPDVVIRAKQYGIDLITNETGTAYSGSIPTTRISDVVMEENSSFDPTWISGYEGASILLRPTETTRLEFPVLRGAEMDGTATVKTEGDKPSAARSMTIKLITPDGETVKSTVTPFDGFYIIERIRPGVYYMTTDSSQSPTTAYRLPEKIVITPEGAQIYGKNIELTRGYDIPFTFSAANTNPALARRTKILKPEDIAREDVYIRLGNYRSGLALALDWYKFKLRSRGWQNRLTPVATDFDTIARDANTGLLPLRLQPRQPLRLADAALLCERLVDAGFKDCGVEVVTTYHGDEPQAADAASTPSKG